ncbi:hypothetical protein [Deinococcus sp. QL22]|uniref:hypothetical protein n=1 Tax=Deinococcus sp. QL22 TaxID=2939437 RepID=UPI002017DDDE|nr:hypothetical protein [Deinococcus sp. QL22]UQN08146.1 hypothetical protein M1R55_18860 [Deinococcus sp. QL22]
MFAALKADNRFSPVAVYVDEIDGGNQNINQASGRSSQAIKDLFVGRIENLGACQIKEPGSFIGRNGNTG